mmetsp:Transcript_19717/g.43888  ORF Transcript_19717/g.43888 Transcript_19717/m.43888 type:complete len:91 (+) Transcript_19717:711-983(+)
MMAGGLADLCLPHFGLMILRPQRRVAGSLVSCLSGRNLAIEAARLYAIVLALRPGCSSRRATPAGDALQLQHLPQRGHVGLESASNSVRV